MIFLGRYFNISLPSQAELLREKHFNSFASILLFEMTFLRRLHVQFDLDCKIPETTQRMPWNTERANLAIQCKGKEARILKNAWSRRGSEKLIPSSTEGKASQGDFLFP